MDKKCVLKNPNAYSLVDQKARTKKQIRSFRRKERIIAILKRIKTGTAKEIADLYSQEDYWGIDSREAAMAMKDRRIFGYRSAIHEPIHTKQYYLVGENGN